MSARDLSADEKAEVARFGIHDEEPRWKVACINWPWPDAPHAMTYLLIDGTAVMERFWPTWGDAIAWLNEFADQLDVWAEKLAQTQRDNENGAHDDR